VVLFLEGSRVKPPFKVCLGDNFSLPYIEKNLEFGMYRIQTENGTRLLIKKIGFTPIKNKHIHVISLKTA
jgi:hypothetical protein